jgi:prepilin-type N-terminal cleavage/methylation domain-containing protein
MRGFTLVELLVAMAIFITVITIATGALFSAQAINVRLEQTQVILDEVNLATEMMVRDIRYGTTFYCDTTSPGASVPTSRKSCAHPAGGTVLIFRPAVALSGSTNQLNDRIAYYISNGILYKKEYSSGGEVRTFQMTSSSINVSNLTFFVTGAQSTTGTNDFSSLSDINQPLVTILISGMTVPRRSNIPPVPFSVETSASSREIDN